MTGWFCRTSSWLFVLNVFVGHYQLLDAFQMLLHGAVTLDALDAHCSYDILSVL